MAIEQGNIIDTHAFYGRGRYMGVQHRTTKYFEDPRFSNTHFLVMPFQASSNSPTLEKVRKDPRFLGMYLMFDPNENSKHSTSADSPGRIGSLATYEHVVGLKTLPSQSQTRMDDPIYFPYYNIASKRGIPVLIHASGSGQDYNSTGMTREILERFPGLQIILAHFGGLNPKYIAEAVKLAEEFSSLYLNTTTMDQMGRSRRTDPKTNQRYVDTTIPEGEIIAMKKDALALFFAMCIKHPLQILFGSDLGYNPPSEYSLWPVTEVDESTAKLIFIDNPKRLFGNKMKAI